MAAKEGEHYHARYRFTHDDYETVEVAVRVEMLNGHAAKIAGERSFATGSG